MGFCAFGIGDCGGSKTESVTRVITDITSKILQENKNSSSYTGTTTQTIACNGCKNCTIDNVNQTQFVQVQVITALKSLTQGQEATTLAQEVAAVAKQLTTGVVSELEKLLSSGQTAKAEAYIKTQINEYLTQENINKIYDNLNVSQSIVATGCDNFTVSGVNQTQTFNGIIEQAIASGMFAKIFTDMSQLVTVKSSNTNKDFNLEGIILILGLLLVFLVLLMVLLKKK